MATLTENEYTIIRADWREADSDARFRTIRGVRSGTLRRDVSRGRVHATLSFSDQAAFEKLDRHTEHGGRIELKVQLLGVEASCIVPDVPAEAKRMTGRYELSASGDVDSVVLDD